MPTREAIKNLEQIKNRTFPVLQYRTGLRQRMTLIDAYISKESATHRDKIAGQQAQRMGAKDKIADIEVGLVFTKVDTAQTKLQQQLLSGYPIFRMTASEQYEAIASQFAVLMGRDQNRFRWEHHITQCLNDALKYNFCAAEVQWTEKVTAGAVTQLTAGSSTTAATKAVTHAGNEIKRLDPYNVFMDPTVLPSEVHEKGAYAGYTERLSYIALKSLLDALPDEHLVKAALGRIIGSATTGAGLDQEYYRPSIRKVDSVQGQDTDWQSFFGTDSKHRETGGTGVYNVTTAYHRIIPIEFGITGTSSSTPQVWKLIWVNDSLIYTEPLQNNHEYLPIIIGQAYDDGLGMETQSFAELTMDLQDAASSMVNGTMAAMRRAIADRGLYNPQMIKSTDINSDSPKSKIPVKFGTFDGGFDQAYRPLDFRDSVTPAFQNNLGTIVSLSDQVTGVNPVTEGQFVPGNKTLFEVDAVIGNADARVRKIGTTLGANFLQPIKHILRFNYLINSVEETVPNAQGTQEININPSELRQQAAEFFVADSLNSVQRIKSTDAMITAIQLFGQNPNLAIEYDVGKIMVSFIRNQGFDTIDEYKRDEEEQARYIQQTQQINSTQPTQTPAQIGDSNGTQQQ